MKTTVAVMSATILAAAALLSAPSSAQAYPAGQEMTVSASKYVVDSGSRIYVQAKHAFPGCRVYFKFTPKGGNTRNALANRSGSTSRLLIRTPSRPGTYDLVAKTKGHCKPGSPSQEVATTTIEVVDN
jgi:polyisoprenoid-binding protein YceI